MRKDSYGAAVIRAMEKWVHQERDQAQAEVRTLTKQVDAKSKMKSYWFRQRILFSETKISELEADLAKKEAQHEEVIKEKGLNFTFRR